MVSYVNHLSMYPAKGGHQYSANGWCGWQPHNYEEQSWNTWNAHMQSAASEWVPENHQFPKREPSEREMSENLSPPRGDLTSEGSTASRPSLAPPPQSTPLPPRSPYEWMKKPNYQTQPNPGKTRTKDKYRVVYTDHQRLELEKEFHYSRYITIRRKAELAVSLGLSERQVKIWFQNRRAKERKLVKKREEVVMKDKSDHNSLHQAQIHHATMLHHQQVMSNMMQHHHHHYHQGVLPETLVSSLPTMPGMPAVPLL